MMSLKLLSRAFSGAFGVAVLSGMMLPAAGLAAGAAPVASESFRADTRGFGDVKVTLTMLGGSGSLTTFDAQDAEHAKLCASKRLADLLGFGDIKEVAGSGLSGTVLELAGAGCWLLGVDGSKFHEIYAPNRGALARLAKKHSASSWQPATPRAYPRWLDCFDNAGPGVWLGGGGAQYTLPSDFEWLKERRLTMCTLSPTDSRMVGLDLVFAVSHYRDAGASDPGHGLGLQEGWTLKVDGQPDRVVPIGAFGTLGLPEETKAVFEKTVAVPPGWKGRNVSLVFDAEHWFWGILPQGRLLVNGKAAAITQPIIPKPLPSFSADVTEAAATGSLTIRLEVDGSGPGLANKNQPGQEKKGKPKPNGVTGLFFLEATAPSTQTQPLPGPWYVAKEFNRLQPVKPGDKADGLYLETRFVLSDKSPGQRLFLTSPDPLGFVMLNGCPLLAPSSMKELDISGLAYRDGRENVLRSVPAAREPPRWNLRYTGAVPQLNLEWK